VSLATEGNAIQLPLDLDWRVLLFAGAAAVATCIIFGALPAARVTRMQPDSVMRAGGRGLTAGRERFWMQRAMVMTQVAVSMVLLSGALLFVRSFRNLMTFDPGMRQQGITVAQVGLPHPVPEERVESFHRELLEQAAAVPGVHSVASATHLPLWGGAWSHGIEIGSERGWARFSWVSERYFETMGVPVLAGRGFDPRDTRSSQRVAVVNETFVKRYCGGANPIGRSLRTGAEPGFPSTVYEIVGVIPETRYSGLRDSGQAMVFAPAPQFPQSAAWANLMIYAGTPHAATVAAMKARLERSFPEMVMEFVDFRKRIEEGLTQERLMATLSGFFAALAVALAIIGLYGVVSYTTTRRRNEIGIRVALGARRPEVVGMILRDSARMLLPGLAIGAALSLTATRGAGALLFGIEPWDGATLAASAALLAAVAVAASWIPARRAAGLDPLAALRHE
jgi:predicted permease